jgi:hypothetical protein
VEREQVNFFNRSGRETGACYSPSYALTLLGAADRSLLARYLGVVVKTPRLNCGARYRRKWT